MIMKVHDNVVLVECKTANGETRWVLTTFVGVSAKRHAKKLAKAGLTRVCGFGYVPSGFDPRLYLGRV